MSHEMVCRDVVLQLTHAALRPTTCPIEAYRYDRFRKSLTRKASPELCSTLGLPSKSKDELTAAAVDSFLDQERLNRESNHRIFTGTSGFFARVCHSAGLIARKILGDFPFDQLIDNSGFGPGSMVGCTGRELSLAKKFAGDITYTAELQPLLAIVLREVPVWQPSSTRVVPGGEFFTVPKDSATDRGCEKQPSGNLFLQKGVGSLMRRRLLRAGIDLSDQSINQERAREGSVTDQLVTWDGRNASNSLSYWLVREVLWASPDWFWIMDKTRTHSVKLPDGSQHKLEMFSAMGNGFTFELESLLFYALAKATAELLGVHGQISVYGDDLIFPVELFDDVKLVFSHFGITTNDDKSFASGPFRESCGGDYYLGHNVTPLYLKKDIRHLGHLIRLANQIRLVATKWGHGLYADSSLYNPWKFLVDYLIQHGAAYGPSNMDGVIHSPRESCSGRTTRSGYLRINRVLASKTRTHRTPEKGQLPAALILLGGEGNPIPESYHPVEFGDTKRSTYFRWVKRTCYHPVWAEPWL